MVQVSHPWCHENKENGTKIPNANYTEIIFSEYVSGHPHCLVSAGHNTKDSPEWW